MSKSRESEEPYRLLNFFEALKLAAGEFLERLERDTSLQKKTLDRYEQLRKSAKT